jgi:hypothetical protein
MAKAWRVSRELFGGDPLGRITRAWSVLRGGSHWLANRKHQFGSADDAQNALAIFPRWVTAFHHDGRTYGAPEPLISDQDQRIAMLDGLEPVRGRSVLEIGPLEGGHSKQMLDLGAEQVVAIESNPEAYLKCLAVKSALGLDHAHFVYGDCNQVIARQVAAGRSFDICSAVGVIYHFSNPLESIRILCSAAPVTYIWTHVASDRQPRGAWTTLTDGSGKTYQGRVNHYPRGAHLGGIDATATWLTESSLVAAFESHGREVQILDRQDHPHGDAVTAIAKRKV